MKGMFALGHFTYPLVTTDRDNFNWYTISRWMIVMMMMVTQLLEKCPRNLDSSVSHIVLEKPQPNNKS